MTPIEIFEYKLRWKPGYVVRLHSDVVDKGKTWCRRQLERHQWSMSQWTGPYEHTFHFEDKTAGQNFEIEMAPYANQESV